MESPQRRAKRLDARQRAHVWRVAKVLRAQEEFLRKQRPDWSEEQVRGFIDHPDIIQSVSDLVTMAKDMTEDQYQVVRKLLGGSDD